jgi:hypothetical protein
MDLQVSERITSLEHQLKTTRWLLLMVLLGAIVIGMRSVAANASPQGEHLRVRSLAVVDELGATRLLMAAPLPNPVSGGKESPRRNQAFGIQFNDAKGNEFGGLTIAEDGALVECFDWVHGEATCMFTMPSGEAGFEVNEQAGKTRGQLFLSKDGAVQLTLNDAGERPRIAFRVTADGKAMIQTPDHEK